MAIDIIHKKEMLDLPFKESHLRGGPALPTNIRLGLYCAANTIVSIKVYYTTLGVYLANFTQVKSILEFNQRVGSCLAPKH
jgi:hypothetical protein